MKTYFNRFCSMVLTIVMLINLLPLNVIASELQEVIATSEINTESIENDNAHILEEVIEKRTETSKEYVLSNGLHLSAVYADAVHYENDGEWEEIDNTLKLSKNRTGNAYINTAGVWNVCLPQNLNSTSPVIISKDGYTLSFYMTGELRSGSGDLEVAAIGSETESYSVQSMDSVEAEVAVIDFSEEKAAAEYPETVSEKIHSRLEYENVYANTDIRYDLHSNQVKESIIIEAYTPALRGYQYTLSVGNLVPVMTGTGEIQLFDESKTNIVMVMPAPFLVDDGGEFCTDINVTLEESGDNYTLTYLLPQSWLAAEDRLWPVVLDPVVEADTDISNIRDVTVYEKNGYNTHTAPVLEVGHSTTHGTMRTFLKYRNLPSLSSADMIVSASIYLGLGGNYSEPRVIEARKVLNTWESETLTWAKHKTLYSDIVADYNIVTARKYYSWDITDIVREWYESKNTGVMFKALDSIENTTSSTDYTTQFYSSDFSEYHNYPELFIVFRNNNGLESYWDYTASSAGRAGTGYINNYTGNLVWVRDDIGFGGNLMPVTISHIYNSNDNTNNLFGLGYGWRTNFNQRVYIWDEGNAAGDYYVWEDSDGTRHYFVHNEGDSANEYKDEDGLELTLTTNPSTPSASYEILDKNGNISCFDSKGRLFKQINDQEQDSSINITYTADSGYKIQTIKDGIGREYTFIYTLNNDSYLDVIRYKGTGTTSLTSVYFAYDGANLATITDKDGGVSNFTYTTNNLLDSAQDVDGYKLTYTYNTLTEGLPSRISSVTETYEPADGSKVTGGSLTIAYAKNQTTFTDFNGNVQVMQFNNWGNTVAIQDNQGRAQYAQYANNDPRTDSTNKGNQLMLSSKLQNTVSNLINNSNFERTPDWTATNSTITFSALTGTAYLGNKSVKMVSTGANSSGYGISKTFSVVAGETYTFSAYVKTSKASAYLQLSDSSSTETSEVVASYTDWTRLEVSLTATSSKITAKLLTTDEGHLYMDCAQLEKSPTASRYNLVENGDFRETSYWSGGTITQRTEGTAAPQLDATVCTLSGDPQATSRVNQDIQVKGEVGDTFVIAGWAYGYSVPLSSTENNRKYGFVVNFLDGSTVKSTKVVQFNPSIEGWQYVADVLVADTAYTSIKVQLAYDYNANDAYFDGIQLYKEEFGQSYVYDDDGNVVSVTDLQKQKTTYEYEDNDLSKAILPSGAVLEYDYDDWHNVISATSSTGIEYSFTYDQWGNNTSVSIAYDNKSITSSASYTADHNRLSTTTDAAGNVTQYEYDKDTNVLKWVQYPNDTAATRTNYTYDEMYRMASAAMTTDSNLALRANYTYENDLLTKIQTPSTTYTFGYGNFALRSNVKIGDRTLAEYTYTDKTNYLNTLAYGNDYGIQYTYDQQGRVTQEADYHLENESPVIDETVTYQYDNSGALATVIDSETGITSKYYYDFIDRLCKYTESGENYSLIMEYGFDNMNNITTIVETINGNRRSTSITYDDDNRVTSLRKGSVTEAYTYDDYSRVMDKTTTLDGVNKLTEHITYRSPSTRTTTGQIASLTIDAVNHDVTYSYTYDNNGNILSVSDGTHTTTYTYDSANQLIRENNQAAEKTWTWTYDNAGNILSRDEYDYATGDLSNAACTTVNYAYGDTSWGDLLTSYNGQDINYDDIGNPLTDGTWTYTWQHGRELASMTDGSTTWNYTYNADGLRTKRTNGSLTYQYYYADGQLVRIAVGNKYLDISYDASGTPMSLYYSGYQVGDAKGNYYYVTNVQGDVVAIVNDAGEAVVTYTYDAWGNILEVDGDMASTLGVYNPLRYRGYVYDNETGLYYLQSRYYDPEIGRFINADGYASTGQGLLGNNMFAYCNNSPVFYADDGGTRPIAYSEDGKELEEAREWSYAYMNKKTTVDLTDVLTSFMQDNAAKLTEYEKENGYAKAALYFYDNVKDGGSLDIKLQDDWAFKTGFTYTFRGERLRYDDPGNINFGYVGAVLFSDGVLCCGAGINQISKWGFEYGDITTWFDDPRDNEMIKLGYSIYWEEHQ